MQGYCVCYSSPCSSWFCAVVWELFDWKGDREHQPRKYVNDLDKIVADFNWD